ERARLIVQASTAAELSTGRGASMIFFFILSAFSVTLPSRQSDPPFINRKRFPSTIVRIRFAALLCYNLPCCAFHVYL
ncbi:MAG: hypothetical protein IIX44_03765, partial [Clostridia bacterium]|nr:hypothetical protein [Clostridia bacterium]